MNNFILTQSEVLQIEKLKNSNILVTGGTGFIGKWILEAVVFLNDNFAFNIKLYLLARHNNSFVNSKIIDRKDVIFIKNDIRSMGELPENIDYIIHAAVSPDNREHMSNPIDIMDIISQGTKQLLDASLHLNSLKKILNISSGQVYGTIDSGHIFENSNGVLDTNSIKSIYPEAKRYGETLGIAYKSLYKLPIVQVRPFSFIGPHMGLNKPWAINNFIHDALKFKKIKILGNGKPIRSYMYPSDMVWWLFNILLNGRVGTAYNLGSPEGISLEDLALKIKNKIGNEVQIDIQNMNNDNSIFVPDVSLVKNELNLAIKVDIDEALNNTIIWGKDHL